MATKKVQVEIQQDATFRTECKAGKHTLLIDQPVAAGGTDSGPTPLDMQLLALGGCIAAIGRIVAKQRKLDIRGFKIAVEGDIDTDGLLGKPTPQRVGFQNLSVRVRIDADLSVAEKEALLHEIDLRCPISENLQNPSTVRVTLDP
ncbi:MAG: OsmC family protein [Kiritimatiellia bacterium]|nr:OsmC family protein [Kiritimatiellia bacterium]